MEGGYEGDFMSVRVILMDPGKGVAAASVDVGMNGCGAVVSGLGEMTARKLVISPYEKLEGGDACRVTLEFDKSWKKVAASDNGQCTAYHGVSCSWQGQSAKKVRY